ncbi:MAG: HNH endonuclease [Candidatus Promineifilaceae bacterium]
MSPLDKLREPVLILNVNFEPLHVCDTKRALGLVFSGKAEILLNGRGTIRSTSAEYDIPSVIRLGYMVRRPRLEISLTKREILRRDEYTCQYCGYHSSVMTVDHVVPRRLGGTHSWTNVVAACPSCNRKKGGKLSENVNMRLRRQPFRPKATAAYRFGQHLALHTEWEQFISGW